MLNVKSNFYHILNVRSVKLVKPIFSFIPEIINRIHLILIRKPCIKSIWLNKNSLQVLTLTTFEAK